MEVLKKVFHPHRIQPEGLDLSGVKVSKDEEQATYLDGKRHELASRMAEDFTAALNGTAKLSAFDRAGSRAAREHVRAITGESKV